MPFARPLTTPRESNRSSSILAALATLAGGACGFAGAMLVRRSVLSNGGGRTVLIALAIIVLLLRGAAVRWRRWRMRASVFVPPMIVMVVGSVIDDAAQWGASAFVVAVSAAVSWAVARVAVRGLHLARLVPCVWAASLGALAVAGAFVVASHSFAFVTVATAVSAGAAFATVLAYGTASARRRAWCPRCRIPSDLTRSIVHSEPEPALLRAAVARGSLGELLALPAARAGRLYIDVFGCPRCSNELCFDVTRVGEDGRRVREVDCAELDAAARSDLLRTLGEGGYR